MGNIVSKSKSFEEASKESRDFLSCPFRTKKEENLINFTQIIGHAGFLKKAKKSHKNTLSGNIGHAQHAQACPGCPPLDA